MHFDKRNRAKARDDDLFIELALLNESDNRLNFATAQRIDKRLKALAEKTVRNELGEAVEVRVFFSEDVRCRGEFETGCELKDSLLRDIFKARYDWLEAVELSHMLRMEDMKKRR